MNYRVRNMGLTQNAGREIFRRFLFPAVRRAGACGRRGLFLYHLIKELQNYRGRSRQRPMKCSMPAMAPMMTCLLALALACWQGDRSVREMLSEPVVLIAGRHDSFFANTMTDIHLVNDVGKRITVQGVLADVAKKLNDALKA
jgi:hypothetical protein